MLDLGLFQNALGSSSNRFGHSDRAGFPFHWDCRVGQRAVHFVIESLNGCFGIFQAHGFLNLRDVHAKGERTDSVRGEVASTVKRKPGSRNSIARGRSRNRSVASL